VLEGLLVGRRGRARGVPDRAARLMVSGSDRACEHWRENYRIDGVDELDLHHLYRAMSWLGEELPESEKRDRTLVPRCIKDLVEEQVFERPRCARAQYQGGRSPSASRCRPTSVKPTRSRRPEMRLDPTSVVLRTPRTRVTAWRHTFFSSMVLKLAWVWLLPPCVWSPRRRWWAFHSRDRPSP
jgi:hypothetical protein